MPVYFFGTTVYIVEADGWIWLLDICGVRVIVLRTAASFTVSILLHQ